MTDVRPVTPERWHDMVDLFERRGPRGGHRNVPAYGCWCMWWRDRSLEHGTPKKRRMSALVRAGREPGLLAYENGTPVGWVSVAPRQDFAVLLKSPQYRPRDAGEDIWSVVCFLVDKGARGRGLVDALLRGATEHAFAHGARAVEAYPHASKTDDYMGNVAVFEQNGFVHVRDTSKRAIMRLTR